MASAASRFSDPTIARQYESWYTGPGRAADVREKQLLRQLLDTFPGAHLVLDIGCGTGHFTRWLDEIGHCPTGLDNSPEMLAEARRRSSKIPYYRGDAEALPFIDRSFDLAMLVTVLEFVEHPVQILSEAMRVARRGIVVGALNRPSFLPWQRYFVGGPIRKTARLLMRRELVDLIHEAGGERVESVKWRTTLWPIPFTRDPALPWGGFIGLAAKLKDNTNLGGGAT